ncbi:MAG: hypothetical protein JO313_05310 [Verrucomicrobia bacterium]|nr:hypothetical protein [Verrucomicrobiota bacterium]
MPRPGTVFAHAFMREYAGLDDRYRGIYNGRRVVFMNPDDIEAARFTAGQPID